MRFINLRNAVIGTLLGAFAFVGSATAQNVNEEYREWQRAQQRAQREYREYRRTRSARDYRQWQNAQARAQREYLEYQRANRMYNAGSGIGYGYGRAPVNTRVRGYRVYRNGGYYTTTYEGGQLLQRAVNLGYQYGYRDGQNDRARGSGFNYADESAYRNATPGYQAYVARDQYQYYFREGFRRGYEDGYRSQMRYGYRTNNGFNILGTVLNSILRLTQY